MARRSDHTREQLKEIAILAGQELLAESDFSGFSAREVARRIGYTVGTLYHVFGNYDAIVLHINAVTLDDLEAFLSEGRGKKRQGAAAIKHLAARYEAFARRNYHRWSALFEHRLPPEMPLPAWYAEKVARIFSAVEAPLTPLVGEEKAHHAARVLWASIHGICALGLAGKLDIVGAKSIASLTDSLIDNYLAGLTDG